jgi:uncharacterized protein (TIGR02598 family)
VVIAIGIVAFAFISIIGLIPSGLSNMKGSTQTTLMSMIAQKMINDAAQTDFDVLTNNALATNYFDDQGNVMSNSSSSTYWANLSVSNSTMLPGAPANINLAMVTVSVAYNPNGTAITNWTTPPAGVTMSRFVTQVANNTSTTNN